MTRPAPLHLLLLILGLTLTLTACPSDDDDVADDDDSATDDDDAVDDDDSATDDDDASKDDDDVVDDDDLTTLPTLQDMAGWYLLEQATFETKAGPVDVTRTATLADLGFGPRQVMIRGWVRISAASADAGTVENAWGLIAQNMLQQVVVQEMPVALLGDELQVSIGNETGVYEASLDGETLTLTTLVDHPDHTNDGGPIGLVMTRMAEPSSEVDGSWDVTTLHMGKSEVGGGACTQVGAGSWAVFTAGFEFNNTQDLVQTWSQEFWGAAGCAGPADETYGFVGPGFFDVDEAAETISAWVLAVDADGDDQQVTFSADYALDGDSMEVTVDVMLLEPEGDPGSVPDALTLTRTP
jgi:hypothetical protein